jgi:hypothetical protein
VLDRFRETADWLRGGSGGGLAAKPTGPRASILLSSGSVSESCGLASPSGGGGSTARQSNEPVATEPLGQAESNHISSGA